jgi:hypothetical protein
LAEWAEFVDAHPEYLSINQQDLLPIKAIVNAIEWGLDNITNFVTNLMVLKDRLFRSEFVRNQLTEYTDIYNQCLAAKIWKAV